jgi:uroporphyrinogen-III synthase
MVLAHSARAAKRISDLVGCARDHLALVAISPAVAARCWRGMARIGHCGTAR